MASLNPISNGTPLGRKRAAHLLRRATFGPTKQDVDTFSALTIDQALTILLQPKEAPPPPVDPATNESWINPRPGGNNSDEEALKAFVTAWWGHLMKNDGNSIIEKMVWFYHTHFTTIISRVPESTAIYYQLALFRHFALGNFKEISKKICYDNAMLYNLDGRLNIKGRVQENFAREYLELYTIGKGPQVGSTDYTNYTEQDVKEGARVLSGFGTDTSFENIDEETGIAMGQIKGFPNASQHDDGSKTFSHRFQNTTITTAGPTAEDFLSELDEFTEMIFAQEETARYICRRLYRFFVYYKIPEEVEKDIIEPLAATFRDNDYELLPVLDQLLRSQHFYDEDNGITTDDNIGAIIKSPLDLTLGALRFFNVFIPDKETQLERHYQAWNRILYNLLRNQGLNFYEPYDVAGYEAYHQFPVYNRSWISPNNLIRRYDLSTQLIEGNYTTDGDYLFEIDTYGYVAGAGIENSDANTIVQHFTDNMFPEAITPERFQYFVDAFLGGAPLGVPGSFEFIDQLRNLVKALIGSPEYQLM